MNDPAPYRVSGRWVTMSTARRCIHHVELAEKCEACGLTATLRAELGGGDVGEAGVISSTAELRGVIADQRARLDSLAQQANAARLERDSARQSLEQEHQAHEQAAAERDIVMNQLAAAEHDLAAARLALKAAQDRLSQFEAGGRFVSPEEAPQSQDSSTRSRTGS